MSVSPGRREFLERWWSFRPTGTGVLILGGLVVGCRLLGLPLAAAIALPILAGAGLAAVLAVVELSNERANQSIAGQGDEPSPAEQPTAGGSTVYAVDEQADPVRRVDLTSGGDES
ncbi:hypothetical protein [Microbispora sp. CA-102843]|uniref:hypothetical protein n=1 Tax=Microbispora sp. CA-102843 TaxID=3239952 RepID=UPI003D8FF4B8